MTKLDELERSVERLGWGVRSMGLVCAADEYEVHCAFDRLLSKQAELLATVERMRVALMAAQSFIADGGLAETDPGASVYRQVTAALTTGEATTPNAGERG